MARAPRLLIICGVPFAGKTTLACELARQLPARRIAIDDLNDAAGRGAGGDDLTAQDWDAVYGQSFRLLDVALASGESVVYDGHCWSREQRDHLRELAARQAAMAGVILVETSEAAGRARWKRNRQQPTRHDVSDENIASALSYYEPPDAGEIIARFAGEGDVVSWVEKFAASLRNAEDRIGIMEQQG